MQSGHIFEENEAFNWSQKCRFLGWIFVPLKEKLKKSKLQSKCYKIRTDWQCHGEKWRYFSVLPQGHTFVYMYSGILASWFFIHYRKSVTSNTCVHSNFGMTTNQNLRSTKRFAVIGYTGSKRSRAICCFLTRNEIITENEKKVNILITFQFYQLLFLFLTNL
jgi:hypothetical protein